MDIELRKPGKTDIEELHRFFGIVIADTFEKEGIGHMRDGICMEVDSKKQLLEEYFVGVQTNCLFFLACHGRKIIGTIAYNRCNKLIEEFSQGGLRGIGEINTVFVLPDFQRRGVGTLLLNSIYLSLIAKGIAEFCLDSGYAGAQKIWRRRFGEPEIVVPDFWGEGFHHMIWHCRMDDISVSYGIW